MSSHLKANHEITEEWVIDKQKEEDLASSDMNDASFEENDEEENEKAAIKNFIEVKTNNKNHINAINILISLIFLYYFNRAK
jgi:hypothetical protein